MEKKTFLFARHSYAGVYSPRGVQQAVQPQPNPYAIAVAAPYVTMVTPRNNINAPQPVIQVASLSLKSACFKLNKIEVLTFFQVVVLV